MAKEDSTVAAKLRAAGAVILGKTNLSEWANFRSNHSTSGWSSRGGQTRNPYALDRNPCGSSSGSGAAVAANLCAAAVGTETDGSIICPSQTCGIVGIKPTLGLVSRAGIIPIAHSQDTAGPMARTVADAAILLAALAGAGCDGTRRLPQRHDHLAGLHGRAATRTACTARASAWRATSSASTRRWTRSWSECIARSARRGRRDRRSRSRWPHVKELGETEMEVLLYEFKADLNAYLREPRRAGAARWPR